MVGRKKPLILVKLVNGRHNNTNKAQSSLLTTELLRPVYNFPVDCGSCISTNVDLIPAFNSTKL